MLRGAAGGLALATLMLPVEVARWLIGGPHGMPAFWDDWHGAALWFGACAIVGALLAGSLRPRTSHISAVARFAVAGAAIALAGWSADRGVEMPHIQVVAAFSTVGAMLGALAAVWWRHAP